MATKLSGSDIRKVLLEVVEELSRRGSFQQSSVLTEAANRLDIRQQTDLEEALLTAWYDQFRAGHLAWGYNLANPNPPFCHVTDKGRETLRSISRDPANPDGYMAHLCTEVILNEIADSYIREALSTYNANCFKATAVMVGCAAESLTLELRDALVAKMKTLGKTIPRNLQDWRIRTVLNALQKEFESQKPTMDHLLCESFEAYWPAFTQQIRAVRNEAGHPVSVDPVTDRAVHSSLLIFPELAVLSSNIMHWIKNRYA
jgi:hypothetical protein